MNRIAIDINVGLDFIVKGFVWESQVKKGIVVICHGMAEHIKRYDHFASFLSNNGYTVIGYDQRGHGMTAGSIENVGYMSDINNINIMVADLFEVIEFVKAKYPEMPIFLYGHSLGSFLSTNYIQLYGDQIDGVILSGSTLNKGIIINIGVLITKIFTKIKGRKYKSKFVYNLIFGPYNKKFKPNRTSADWLSRDESIADAYVNDPYCGTVFSVSFYKDLLTNFKSIYSGLSFIPAQLPIYLFSGDKDPVGNQGKNTKKLYHQLKKAKIIDVSLKLYPGGRHEMHNEKNKEEVYNDVINWLNEHLK